jgi:hypothetical protein
MWVRAIGSVLVVLAGAQSAAAQARGTVEFGGFASATSFDDHLGMNQGWGGGGRIGVFLAPRMSIEFEGGGSNASRPLGLRNVNVGVLSARLTLVPLKVGAVSVLLGAGVDHTDTYFVESYGAHGLVGAKIGFSDAVALRIDGIASHMSHGSYTNLGLHAGLILYRHPLRSRRILESHRHPPFEDRRNLP